MYKEELDKVQKECAGGSVTFLKENSVGYRRYMNGDERALKNMVMVKIVKV